MHLFGKGVALDQQKNATIGKRIRKLLSEEHYSQSAGAPDPEAEKILQLATPEELREAAAGCGVLDKTDSLPLADKLASFAEHRPSVLVIDAVDDEPYVTCGVAVIQWKQRAFLLAVDCLKQAYGFEKILLVTYDKDIYYGLNLPKDCGIVRKKMRCRYPARLRMLQKYGDRPDTYAVLGAETLLHLYRALVSGKEHNSVIVTVAGTAVGSPCNLEVTAGTPVSAVLDCCGLTCSPAVLVRGGPMTGYAMMDPEAGVTRTDTAFLAFENPVRRTLYGCIGCGRCSRVCPGGLMPDLIYRDALSGHYEDCARLRVDRCLECGCCSYICPSNIDLLAYIRDAKEKLNPSSAEKLPITQTSAAPRTVREEPEDPESGAPAAASTASSGTSGSSSEPKDWISGILNLLRKKKENAGPQSSAPENGAESDSGEVK